MIPLVDVVNVTGDQPVDSPEFYHPDTHEVVLGQDVEWLMSTSNSDLAAEYVKRYPSTDRAALEDLLSTPCEHFVLAGNDTFSVEDVATGEPRMLVIETNSSPAGQSLMPQIREPYGYVNSYSKMIETVFRPELVRHKRASPKLGVLAVLYDKNLTEARGYAHAMSHSFQEHVFLVSMMDIPVPERTHYRWNEEDQLCILHNDQWLVVRAAFRYVTKRPHNRFPIITGYENNQATLVMNPIVGCLAGGRNKIMGAMSYAKFNKQYMGSGFDILTPKTWDELTLPQVMELVDKLDYKAVIKVPYSNCGQGVFIILNRQHMDVFMKAPNKYARYLVQSIVGFGEDRWRHRTSEFHNLPYVFDLRTIVTSTPSGFRPLAMLARRAADPLKATVTAEDEGFGMYGTNLTIVHNKHSDKAEIGKQLASERMILMTDENIAKLKLTRADLVDAYVQTCFSMRSIDNTIIDLLQSPDPHHPFEPMLREEVLRSARSSIHMLNPASFQAFILSQAHI